MAEWRHRFARQALVDEGGHLAEKSRSRCTRIAVRAASGPYAVPIDADVAIALLADLQIRRAIDRGEFDDLPGSGKPLDLSDSHDPDWWLKRLMKREGLVMLSPSIQLRKDDAALDAQLDRLSSDKDVRREIEEFNSRVIRARYELPSGPPLVTMPRDVDQTVGKALAA